VRCRLRLETIAERMRPHAAPREAGATPRAAVAAIVRPGSEPEGAEILLIRRAERAGDPWSGHMAFPGGRRDERDRSLLETATRETLEEVGIALDGAPLGLLPDVPTHRTGLVVRPFVFALERNVTLATSDEVAEALWTPLAPLMRGEHGGTYAFRHEGIRYALPCFRLEDRIVWGLTYRMLELLFETLR
jgi:8-oxo-dGTP pyrophosphatase MutT (NUDIX family)